MAGILAKLTSPVVVKLVDLPDLPDHGDAADVVAARPDADADRLRHDVEALSDAVRNACPDAQWRLIYPLSRFGGLRCPSEHLSLRWGDVDGENDRITVTRPKTEHHEGKGSRVIPFFAELREQLEQAFDDAEDGTEFVITCYRDTNANLRTQLLRIISRAGLEPWTNLFQILRSTRQTELEETFPSHVDCAWMGNSQSVARKHNLQVTDDHFQKRRRIRRSQCTNRLATARKPIGPRMKKPLRCRG